MEKLVSNFDPENAPCPSVRSTWLDIKLASFFLCEFMDLYSVLVNKHAKKNLANIQPS